jgi:hypothetical protein
LWARIRLRQGVLNTTLCDKVCQWLATGQWFSKGTSVSSINKTDRHDITDCGVKHHDPTPYPWKPKISSLRHTHYIPIGDFSWFWLFCLGLLVFLLQKILNYLGFHYLLTLSIPYEGYSRNTLCALNYKYLRFYY